MRRILTIPSVLLAVLAAGAVLSGCVSERASDARPGYSEKISPAMREHRQRQAMRAEEGGYRRIYRQKGCRQAMRGCDGYARFGP